MAKVSLRNVSNTTPGSKSHAAPTRINDLSIEIADHEFVVLAGPGAAGKTNVVRMIAGLDEITRGDIYIGDRRVNDLAPKAREVAMVFATGALYPRMSVAENIAFGLKLRNFAQAEITKRVGDAAAILALEGALPRMPHELSPEKRQRVAIARAVVRQPKVLLFDEPIAGLEPVTRLKLRGEIARLHQRLELTMIFATRDPVDAMALGGRLIVIENGSVQQDGSAAGLYDQPASLPVARFLGAPTMNLVAGTLKQERDALLFRESGDGTIELRFQASDAAEAFAGNEVLLGFRPEHIQPVALTKGKQTGPASFRALVDLVETSGAQTQFHLDTGAHAVVCSARRGADDEPGRRMQFEIDLARACLFDPVSRRRIV